MRKDEAFRKSCILACIKEIARQRPSFLLNSNNRPESFQEIVEIGWQSLQEHKIDVNDTKEAFTRDILQRVNLFAKQFED